MHSTPKNTRVQIYEALAAEAFSVAGVVADKQAIGRVAAILGRLGETAGYPAPFALDDRDFASVLSVLNRADV
jgi:hypothetical protein